MIQDKIKLRAKPLLGNNDITVKDVVKSDKDKNVCKLSDILSKERNPTFIDDAHQLF